MNLKEKYLKEVVPAMKEKFGYKNDLAVPRLERVTVNVGLSRSVTEKDPKYIEFVSNNLVKITGQKPITTLARKSIAGFKIRKGLMVGLKATLRRNRMYDFLEKLIYIALPRTKDFRGLDPNSLDELGNLSLGFREQLPFPEIGASESEKIHGLEVTIVTTAKSREEGLWLFKLLGFPFGSN